MVYYVVPKDDIEKQAPLVEESIETGLEFLLLEEFNKKYYCGNNFMDSVDYTLTSYNTLKKCMPEPTARRNGILNGIEYIMEKYLNSPKIKDRLDQLYNDEGDRDD